MEGVIRDVGRGTKNEEFMPSVSRSRLESCMPMERRVLALYEVSIGSSRHVWRFWSSLNHVFRVVSGRLVLVFLVGDMVVLFG